MRNRLGVEGVSEDGERRKRGLGREIWVMLLLLLLPSSLIQDDDVNDTIR